MRLVRAQEHRSVAVTLTREKLLLAQAARPLLGELPTCVPLRPPLLRARLSARGLCRRPLELAEPVFGHFGFGTSAPQRCLETLGMHIVATEDFDRRLELFTSSTASAKTTSGARLGLYSGMETLAFGGVNFVGFFWRQRPTAFRTVGHFWESGLGPFKTCTQPVGTSPADHSRRSMPPAD